MDAFSDREREAVTCGEILRRAVREVVILPSMLRVERQLNATEKRIRMQRSEDLPRVALKVCIKLRQRNYPRFETPALVARGNRGAPLGPVRLLDATLVRDFLLELNRSPTTFSNSTFF